MNAYRSLPTSQAHASSDGFDRSLFSHSRDSVNGAPLTVEGRAPDWLAGELLRTAPAIFATDAWRANHWFDALGLVYRIAFRANGEVTFHQALLDSEFARQAHAGRVTLASFDTPDQRTTLELLRSPVPTATDNGNVNIVRAGEKWLALTETDRALEVETSTLRSRQARAPEDSLPRGMFSTAHPLPDPKRNCLVNVAPCAGRTSSIKVYEQDLSSGRRTSIASVPVKRLPYVHSFALTDRYVILVMHPFDVNPLAFLWSRNFLGHYRWRPSEGTRVTLVDRASGTHRDFHTDAFFMFHSVNAFETAGEVVLDLLAYDTPGTLEGMRMESMKNRFPDVAGSLRRLRLDTASGRLSVETLLSEPGLEFPTIHPTTRGRSEQRYVWGASVRRAQLHEVRSALLKFDGRMGERLTFEESPYVLGEPVFVRAPKGTEEDDGVLLSVGSHARGESAKLFVIDAKTLAPIATAVLPVPLPFGFHGSFARENSHSLPSV